MKSILEETKNILKSGIPIYGTKERALSRKDSLKVLENCFFLNISILGGDVGEIIEGSFEYNYDNWSCDHLSNETKIEYICRSIDVAKEYILNYYLEEAFFVFVFGIDDDIIKEQFYN